MKQIKKKPTLMQKEIDKLNKTIQEQTLVIDRLKNEVESTVSELINAQGANDRLWERLHQLTQVEKNLREQLATVQIHLLTTEQVSDKWSVEWALTTHEAKDSRFHAVEMILQLKSENRTLSKQLKTLLEKGQNS